nr:hypothetical protein [Candidatus Baldrarchaeota archaeon]
MVNLVVEVKYPRKLVNIKGINY